MDREELDEHLNAAYEKYIADNNIQLYTINAIDKAIEIGMGKRTNTILQSAFFKLANVMPIDEAVEFMKDAAKKSYRKKGDAVEMNYKAIDMPVLTAFIKSKYRLWATRQDDTREGPEGTVRTGQDGQGRYGAHRPHGRRQPAGFCIRRQR